MTKQHDNFEDIPTERKEEIGPIINMLARKQYASFQVRLLCEEYMLTQRELLYVQQMVTYMMYTGEV